MGLQARRFVGYYNRLALYGFFMLRFTTVPDALTYDFRYNIEQGPWSEAIVLSIKQNTSDLESYVRLDHVEPKTNLEFQVRAANENGTSEWSIIYPLRMPVLCTRADVNGNGTVSSFDAHYVLEIATGKEECK